MKLLLSIVILIIISLLGSRLTFLNRRLSLGFRNIMFTGTEYIFIGAVLGSMGLNVLDADALKQLEPFLVFGLGWIGFLFGLQFNVRLLKNLATYYFTISAVQAFVTFILVTGAMYLVFDRYLSQPRIVSLMVAATLGSGASCTAQSALAIVNKNYRFRNRRLMDLMRYISGLDGFYGLLFFAAAVSIFPGGQIEVFDIVKSLEGLGTTVVIGVIPALIMISLGKVRFSEQEFLVFIIGTVTLCGGLAHQVNHSPLIAGLICGVVTVNFCRHGLRALSVVMHAEKSLYIILLLLLGATWTLDLGSPFVLIMTATYFLVRVAGKWSGNLLGVKLFKPPHDVPAGIGLGLLSDGGLTVAIIVNFQMLYPAIADPVVTAVIISVVASEILSPWLILGRFKKEERTAVKERTTGKTSQFRVMNDNGNGR